MWGGRIEGVAMTLLCCTAEGRRGEVQKRAEAYIRVRSG